ncbi:tRNA(1-methyladenosine) methyltransferase-like methyltransferase [Salinarchaeum sp. Harcht-Bsk1]|nr:tRNA(1-methyladenosine) methyltransferase-like methyltransferase [Salinarchaeum sp. Harcht-Bsk1]
MLLVRDDREYLLAPGERLETDLGILEVPSDPTSGETVETHIGEAFTIREPRLPDFFDHFERTGAPMMPRDAGLVLGETGAGSGDRVLDAGTGTGVLAAYLANAGADVLTYERDEGFAENARENFERADLADAVEVRAGDLTDEIDSLLEEGTADDGDASVPFDVLTLDTQDAPAVVERSPELLVEGGALAVYSPFVEATREVVEAARAAGLREIRARETIQRDLDVDERGTRPSTRGVGHTGYLVFARR